MGCQFIEKFGVEGSWPLFLTLSFFAVEGTYQVLIFVAHPSPCAKRGELLRGVVGGVPFRESQSPDLRLLRDIGKPTPLTSGVSSHQQRALRSTARSLPCQLLLREALQRNFRGLVGETSYGYI